MSPRQRILASKPTADAIKAMLTSVPFETASEAALHELVMNQNRGNEGASAIAAHFELEGAKRYLSMLTKIADVPHGNPKTTFGQLDHEMKPPEKK